MKNYWDNAEVSDSNGTLALQVNGYDLMYCSRNTKGALTGTEHQAWVDLIAKAPRTLEVLKNLITMLEEHEDIEHDQFGCAADEPCALCSAKQLLAELGEV